jgi:DNA-binding transcriptional regulator YiaG
MQAMRATLHKLKDLAGKPMLPSRKPSRRAQPDYSHAQTITNLRERQPLLSITQSQFAQFCSVHPNTVCNWASGRTRMNHAALLVLRVLEANHQAAGHVVDQAKGAPRGRPFAPGNPYRFGDCVGGWGADGAGGRLERLRLQIAAIAPNLSLTYAHRNPNGCCLNAACF